MCKGKPGTHPIFYTCHPVTSLRVPRFHSRTAHLNVATSVRPTRSPNSFVAASSGVLHWRALWRVCAGRARGKRQRCSRWAVDGSQSRGASGERRDQALDVGVPTPSFRLTLHIQEEKRRFRGRDRRSCPFRVMEPEKEPSFPGVRKKRFVPGKRKTRAPAEEDRFEALRSEGPSARIRRWAVWKGFRPMNRLRKPWEATCVPSLRGSEGAPVAISPLNRLLSFLLACSVLRWRASQGRGS
jgi:hypothetical protein